MKEKRLWNAQFFVTELRHFKQLPLSLWISVPRFKGSSPESWLFCEMAWKSLSNLFSTHTPRSPTPQLSPDVAFTFSWTWERAVILTFDLYLCASVPSLPGTFMHLPFSELHFHIALNLIQPAMEFCSTCLPHYAVFLSVDHQPSLTSTLMGLDPDIRKLCLREWTMTLYF